jgi:hypothetical protein
MVFFLTSIRSGLFNNLLADYDPTMISVAAMSTYAIAIMIFESVGKGVAAAGRLTTSVSLTPRSSVPASSLFCRTPITRGLVNHASHSS